MRSRMVWLAASLVLLAACTVVVRHVPLPSEPAAPRTILLTYLEALVAGDCATARALATPGLLGYPHGIWCDRPRAVAYKAPAPNDQPGGDPASELVYGVEMNVMGGDVSMPDGWGFWFVDLRRQPDGTWRVSGVGSGP